jgi:2-polyprenyl-3-methyl-5-hydroxy-6-metoxy-1,4-benzoquinol methylase
MSDNNDDYYTGGRHEILPFIPEDAHVFLDVGCGSGNFGAMLKSRFKGATVWGSELNSRIAAQAAEKLDKVIAGDITMALSELPEKFFDCITFNDSLEHLADPFSLLAQIKSKLSDRGVVVSSIPNVRYFDNLRDLIFKKQWKYVDAGVLDRTHLRFFTQQSIIDMYQELGYRIEAMAGINRTGNKKARALARLTFGWLDDTLYLQFATRARPI